MKYSYAKGTVKKIGWIISENIFYKVAYNLPSNVIAIYHSSSFLTHITAVSIICRTLIYYDVAQIITKRKYICLSISS